MVAPSVVWRRRSHLAGYVVALVILGQGATPSGEWVARGATRLVLGHGPELACARSARHGHAATPVRGAAWRTASRRHHSRRSATEARAAAAMRAPALRLPSHSSVRCRCSGHACAMVPPALRSMRWPRSHGSPGRMSWPHRQHGNGSDIANDRRSLCHAASNVTREVRLIDCIPTRATRLAASNRVARYERQPIGRIGIGTTDTHTNQLSD